MSECHAPLGGGAYGGAATAGMGENSYKRATIVCQSPRPVWGKGKVPGRFLLPAYQPRVVGKRTSSMNPAVLPCRDNRCRCVWIRQQTAAQNGMRR